MRTIKAKLQKVLKRHGKFVPRIDLLKSINKEQLEIIRELKAELEMERNKHIKIQYDDNEYTISEICDRLSNAEKERFMALNDLYELRKKTGWKCSYCYYDKHYDRNVCTDCNYEDRWAWHGFWRAENG